MFVVSNSNCPPKLAYQPILSSLREATSASSMPLPSTSAAKTETGPLVRSIASSAEYFVEPSSPWLRVQ